MIMSIAEFKIEKITSGIYENAVKLEEIEKYKQKQPTMPYHLCNALVVNHTNRTFWFTNQETAEHTLSINN